MALKGDLKKEKTNNDNEHYSVETCDNNGKIYRFYTSMERSIYSDASWYKPLLMELCKGHKPSDRIEIYLDSYGGSIACTDTLISAIERCDCDVHLFVSGLCMSAATLITFIPKNYASVNISDYCSFLFHSGSGFTWGKFADMKDQIDGFSDIQDLLFDDAYKDILTDKEIKKIKEGKELYLTGKEVNRRYDAIRYRLSKEDK